jgi:hypothetical protein
VGNVEHGLGGVLEVVAAAVLGRGVGADVDVLAADGNFLAFSLVGGAIDLLEVVRVGDDLVTGNDVLQVADLAHAVFNGGAEAGSAGAHGAAVAYALYR